jgi:hypothetical protein
MRQPDAREFAWSATCGVVVRSPPDIRSLSLPLFEESGVYHAHFASSRSMVLSPMVAGDQADSGGSQEWILLVSSNGWEKPRAHRIK